MRRAFAGSVLALGLIAGGLLAVPTLAAQGPARPKGPVNLGLEDGELGKIPTGWFQPGAAAATGYKVELTEEGPHSGKRCVRISRVPGAKAPEFGNLMQSFDATAYRGKRVRLRAAVRAEVSGEPSQAQLWLRVDRKDNRMGFFDNMGDRPITGAKWGHYEIVGEVADDAVSINFGLLLVGDGRAWLDSVSFEVLGKAGEGNEPARALEGRALDNLVAFTRLLGYVRYFHPSDQAAATKWDAFALDGVVAVEKARDAAELARVLEKLFQPIAPTVQVFPTGKAPAAQLDPAKDAPARKFVAWYHYGVGLGNAKNIYSSERLDNEELAKRLQDQKFAGAKMPDPSTPLTAELGGGVSCRVPLALYTDDKGTLPRPAAGAGARVSSRPQGFVPNGNDRGTRLAGVALAWNVFQHFYPYFDAVKADWPAELRRALTRAATDRDEDAFLDTLRLLVAALHDGHGNVYAANAARTAYPPLRWDWVEDRLVVTRVAAKGADGLKPGDVVLKVNGRPSAEALADRERLISGATPQWKRYLGLRELAGGAEGSELTLDVRDPSGKARAVRVRRTLDRAAFNGLSDVRPEKIAELKPGILYVDIDRITDKDFRDALPKLEKAKGIIFDLRGYPSSVSPTPLRHLSEKTINSARWQVPITLHPDRRGVVFDRSNWVLKPTKPRFTAKMAFVTDGRAISYAESYMGIVEHYKLADIVGAPTAGTNGNINPFTLPGGYRVVWTGMKVVKHDGSRHHGVGIQPTVPVSRTIRGVAEGRDELLERAIKVVSR
jgi:C-terminal processing protease CtpA/Prc